MVSVVVGEAVEGTKSSYWGMAARGCDSCKGSPALLFCRTDSAFLCGACDVRVHGGGGGGGGKLASRHERVWMCEVCEQAPAAVTCKADAAALCVSCDADIHSANPLARRHERVPVAPFYEYSSAAGHKGAGQDLLHKLSGDDEDDDGVHGSGEAEVASWLLPNPNLAAINNGGHHPHQAKLSMDAPELKTEGDFFFSDVDPYLDLEYSSPMESRYHQMDSVVPVQTAAAAAAVHPPVFVAPNGCIDFDFGKAKPSCGSYIPTPSLSHSISSSDVGVVPDAGAMADITNPYGGRGGTPAPPPAAAPVWMDREARVMRYREKRKNRKFEKTIRYASRKAYAETRPRIKGRFAKRTEVEAEEADHFYSSAAAAAAAFMAGAGYGVVPSF